MGCCSIRLYVSCPQMGIEFRTVNGHEAGDRVRSPTSYRLNDSGYGCKTKRVVSDTCSYPACERPLRASRKGRGGSLGHSLLEALAYLIYLTEVWNPICSHVVMTSAKRRHYKCLCRTGLSTGGSQSFMWPTYDLIFAKFCCPVGTQQQTFMWNIQNILCVRGLTARNAPSHVEALYVCMFVCMYLCMYLLCIAVNLWVI